MYADKAHKITLLLVDDSEDDAFLFNRTILKSGAPLAVHHVPNGAEAINYLDRAVASNSLPRLILLDLKMPMVNGFELLEWMRERFLLSQVAVVVVSGSDQPDDKAKASQLGAVDYLVKPVAVADLQRVLAAVPRDAFNNSPSQAGSNP